MTIKLIAEFWRNQETPEKFRKKYEQDLNSIFWVEILVLSSFNVFVAQTYFSFKTIRLNQLVKFNFDNLHIEVLVKTIRLNQLGKIDFDYLNQGLSKHQKVCFTPSTKVPCTFFSRSKQHIETNFDRNSQ